MRILNKQGLLVFSLASVFTFLVQNNMAVAVSCYSELSSAETQWNEMRSKKEMAVGVERDITRHLRRAAELRHLGDASGCLQEIESAKELMKFGRQKD